MSICATCNVYACRTGRVDAAPDNCPMRLSPDVVDTRETYSEPHLKEMSRVAAVVAGSGYGRWTRLEDTMEFARRLGINKLGLAFCVGLKEEAKTLNRVLEANGFEVVSACCKTGSISKEFIGVGSENLTGSGGFEGMCNSVGQARLLNEAGTGLNVLLGLCVGHDAIFTKYSDAFTTTLVVKDRVLAHNSVAALYCSQGYFNKPLYRNHRPE